MPANYVLLEKITVGAGGATSVTFSGIPQTGYTDLVVKISGRTNRNYGEDQFIVRYSGDSTGNYAYKFLQGYDGTVGQNLDSGTNNNILGMISSATSTANSFGNAELYIANYTSSAYKSITADSVAGTAVSPTGMRITSSVWTNTAAITSIFLDAANGTEWLENSTFYLYGVAKLGTTPAIVPYATGGNTIMTDGTYWYHAFLSSGTFTPAKTLSCDAIVIAGGGSGGNFAGAGGGAGGLLALTSQSISTAQTVTIGAGGAGVTPAGFRGNSGSNSVIGSNTATGGGGGGSGGADGGNGRNGGSGGGAGGGGGSPGTGTGGTGVSGQGFAGGNAAGGGGSGGSGGGGAGAVGANGTSSETGANGGIGSNTYSTWASVTGTGASGYYAGGGGGANGTGVGGGTGGAGGGTGGNSGIDATPNTGGGGGARWNAATSSAGGSGLVIVRYAV
jgi:hypothetical protein